MLVIVFDWDDTLMASTHVANHTNQFLLADLAYSIASTIYVAKLHGQKLHIITNGEKQWVQHCFNHYLPVIDFLADQIEITSTVTEGYNYGDVWYWKRYAFLNKLSSYFVDGETHHLLAFGDTLYDRAAALSIKSVFPHVIVKNVLLHTRPSLEQLLLQQKLIRDCFEFLSKHPNDLDCQVAGLFSNQGLSQTISWKDINQNSASSYGEGGEGSGSKDGGSGGSGGEGKDGGGKGSGKSDDDLNEEGGDSILIDIKGSRSDELLFDLELDEVS